MTVEAEFPVAIEPFSGVVLTGGASRRMGTDKAFVEVDGVALVERVRRALVAAGAAELVAVGGDAERLVASGWRAVPDRWPGAGPLGGVVTGLEAMRCDTAVVVACDLPDLHPAAVTRLLDGLAANPDADAVVPRGGGRLEVLHAAYRRRCAAPLSEAFDDGARSLVQALSGLRVRLVALHDDRTVRDVDTPDDLARVRDDRRTER